MIRLATSIHLNNASVIRYANVIALLLVMLPLSVMAQRLGAGTTFPGNEPGAPAGSYALSGFDTVNLYNGNLNFHLPLLQIGGRGEVNHTIMLSIEQRWTMTKFVNPDPFYISYGANPNGWIGIRPGYGPGVLQARAVDYQPEGCIPNGTPLPASSLTRLTFIAQDGTEYELRDQLYEGRPINYTSCWNHPNTSRGKVFRTADGSAMTFISDYDIGDNNNGQLFLIDPTGYLFMRDGTRYRIEEGLVKWIRDHNGNRLIFTYDENSRVKTITDSLDRLVEIDYYYPPTLAYDSIRYTGFGSAQREVKVYYTSMSQVLEQGYTIQTYHNLFPPPDQVAVPDINPHNPTVVSEVRLPDNRSYQFRYNSHGELARVALPTGGVIKYDWDNGPNTLAGGVVQGPLLPGDNQNMAIYRRVKQRWVYPDGITLEGSTKYTGDDIGGVIVDHLTAASQSPPLFSEKHYFYGGIPFSLVYGYGPNGELVPTDYPDWKEGREYQTEVLSSNGTIILRRRVDTWQQRAPVSWWGLSQDLAPSNDPRLAETMTTLLDVSPNQVSKQSFSYDQYNNRTEAYEYDFGAGSPGTLVRRAHTIYKTDGYDTIAGGINNPDPVATIHIRSLPSQQTVYDANGIERARATYEYDTTPLGGLVDRAGITGLVSRSGQAAGAGYIPTTDLMRGNVTAVTRWLLASTGPETADSGIFSYSQYDIAGNVVKTRDPKGNETTFDYSDSFSGSFTANTYAFLKGATSAIPAAPFGGGQALVSTSVYDFSSGKVIQTIDPNGKVTSFEYIDPLDRLTKVIRPLGGGETVYEYGDTVGDLYLRTQTQQQSNSPFPGYVWIEDRALFDGLGRGTRSAHYEGSDFFGARWSVRDNRYDALGRVSQVSNPEIVSDLNAALPGGGVWTTTTYDALSRVTRVMTPDGAHVDSAYFGNQVTVADQTGKQRSSITDGLGRLIQVNEAPNNSTYNYQTNYTYDTLGNLIRVRQGGFPTGGNTDATVQYRRFYYDSLSRLVYANNPEQNATIAFNPPNEAGTKWTMKYVYDDNGNLTSRTDARNIVTTYGYDALNRNVTVEYSNTPAITGPDIKRFYDTATNGKGRLQRVETYVVNPQNSVQADSRTIIGGYDNLGRVTSQTQGFWKPATGNWQDYAASRGYDLASHFKAQTYPSGSYVSYNYGAGGRTSYFDGAFSGEYLTFSSGMVYNAAGQMTQELLGSSVYHRMDYNNRFQMTEVRVSNNPFDPASWDLGKLRFFYNTAALNAGNPGLPGTDNNGNVLRQEHWVPTQVSNAVYGGQTVKAVNQYAVPMRDDYFYDPINRITQVQGWQQTTGGATPVQIYQQAYSYDKFGNRKIDDSQTTGAGINSKVYDVNKRNNRLYGQVYDAAGNVINDSYSSRLNGRSYDAENRMTVAQQNGQTGYYVYDGDGRRVRRIANGVETWQLYGIDGELLAEYQWNGTTATLKKEYGYRDGQLLVVADSTEANPEKRVQWLVADHLGTPRMTVDKTGSLSGVTRHDYLPFGEELMVGMGNGSIRSAAMGYAADSVRQKFTGKERDVENGLDYFLARYYSSIQGRFTTTDVLFADQYESDPQSWNLYMYVRNNPLKYIDPFGLWKEVKCSVGNCWEAEDGDTLKTLATQSGVSLAALQLAFRRLEITSGETVVSVKGVEEEADQRIREMAEQWTEASLSLIGGGGINKIGSAGGGILRNLLKPSSGAENIAQYERYKALLRRLMSKPTVNDARLQEILDRLYRPNATIGSGSTADAIRHELATGQPVGGVWHSQKGEDSIRALDKWIRSNPNANPNDIHAARQVLLDLKDALRQGNVVP